MSKGIGRVTIVSLNQEKAKGHQFQRISLTTENTGAGQLVATAVWLLTIAVTSWVTLSVTAITLHVEWKAVRVCSYWAITTYSSSGRGSRWLRVAHKWSEITTDRPSSPAYDSTHTNEWKAWDAMGDVVLMKTPQNDSHKLVSSSKTNSFVLLILEKAVIQFNLQI